MLSFADIMLAPIFLRTHLLEHFRKRTAIPDDCMRVKNWMNEVLNHPDIKKTALQGKNLIDKYEPYVTGNHQLKRRWSY
jgi:glutathione S-transferase